MVYFNDLELEKVVPKFIINHFLFSDKSSYKNKNSNGIKMLLRYGNIVLKYCVKSQMKKLIFPSSNQNVGLQSPYL